jgi:hypothetical protein
LVLGLDLKHIGGFLNSKSHVRTNITRLNKGVDSIELMADIAGEDGNGQHKYLIGVEVEGICFLRDSLVTD